MARNNSVLSYPMNNSVSQKHFAFVTYEFYPSTPGGVGILLHNVVSQCLENGDRVSLILAIAPHEFEQLHQSDRFLLPNCHNLKFFRLNEICDVDRLPVEAFPDSAIRDAILFSEAVSTVHSNDPIDFVEFVDYCGLAYQTLIDRVLRPDDYPARIAVRLHNTIEIIKNKIHGPASRSRFLDFAQERSALALADALLTPGMNFQSIEMEGLYGKIGKQVLYSPPPLQPIGKIQYDPDAKNIGFIGRLSTFKGLDVFLIAALALLEKESAEETLGDFWIIGPGESVSSGLSEQDLRGMIPSRFSHRFHFLGRREHPEIIELMGSIRLCVFANRMESFCYAAHEMFTAGMPVIVRDSAAFRDHFEDGRSAIFFDGTAVSLVSKIRELSNNREARIRLSKFGQEDHQEKYFTNHYPSHVDSIRPYEAAPVPLFRTTVLILENGDPEALAESLQSLPEESDTYVLRRVGEDRGTPFLGHHWEIIQAPSDESSSLLFSIVLSEQLVVLNAGDKVETAYFSHAAKLFQAYPQVDFVSCWRRFENLLEIESSNLVPEALLLRRSNLGLGVVHRTVPGTFLYDFFSDWSAGCEIQKLLAAKANGKHGGVITEPLLSRQDLPDPCYMPLSLFLARFSRLISQDFFALETYQANCQVPAGISTALGDPVIADDTWSRLRQSLKFNPGNAVIRIRPSEAEADSKCPCRIREITKPDGTTLEWTQLRQNGNWSLFASKSGPLHGIMGGRSGWVEFQGSTETTIEFLCNPEGSSVEIYFAGNCLVVDLKGDSSVSLKISLGEVCESLVYHQRGFFARPQKMPIQKRLSSDLTRSIRNVTAANNGSLVITGASLRVREHLDVWRQSPSVRYDEFPNSKTHTITRTLLQLIEKAIVEESQCQRLILEGTHPHFPSIVKFLQSRLPELQIRILLPTALKWDPQFESNDIFVKWRSIAREDSKQQCEFWATSKGLQGFLSTVHPNVFPWHLTELPEYGSFAPTTPKRTRYFAIRPAGSVNIMPAVHCVIHSLLTKKSKAYIEASELQAWRVLEDLGFTSSFTRCDSIWEQVRADHEGGVAFYLTPQNDLILPALSILENGKWPITARNDQFFVDDLFNRFFTTPRWEESVSIAEQIEQLLLKDFDELGQQYSVSLHKHHAQITQDRSQILRS